MIQWDNTAPHRQQLKLQTYAENADDPAAVPGKRCYFRKTQSSESRRARDDDDDEEEKREPTRRRRQDQPDEGSDDNIMDNFTL